MKLLLKRDDQTESAPHADQLDVGELVINSSTGKLYSKLTNGSVVEWISQKVCFEPVPVIGFSHNTKKITDILSSFCCAGDTLLADVTNLKDAPANYTFDFIELTENTTAGSISILSPQFSIYTLPKIKKEDPDVYDRKAEIPINLSIALSDNISIFKFTVLLDNKKVSEQVITIRCFEESCAAKSS